MASVMMLPGRMNLAAGYVWVVEEEGTLTMLD
jgi:hypothetical protein